MRIVTRVLSVVTALLALASRVSRVDLAAASDELSNKSQPLERSPLT
jgi:hypothetical protein